MQEATAEGLARERVILSPSSIEEGQERYGRAAASWRERVREIEINCFIVRLVDGRFIFQYVLILSAVI